MKVSIMNVNRENTYLIHNFFKFPIITVIIQSQYKQFNVHFLNSCEEFSDIMGKHNNIVRF